MELKLIIYLYTVKKKGFEFKTSYKPFFPCHKPKNSFIGSFINRESRVYNWLQMRKPFFRF